MLRIGKNVAKAKSRWVAAPISIAAHAQHAAAAGEDAARALYRPLKKRARLLPSAPARSSGTAPRRLQGPSRRSRERKRGRRRRPRSSGRGADPMRRRTAWRCPGGRAGVGGPRSRRERRRDDHVPRRRRVDRGLDLGEGDPTPPSSSTTCTAPCAASALSRPARETSVRASWEGEHSIGGSSQGVHPRLAPSVGSRKEGRARPAPSAPPEQPVPAAELAAQERAPGRAQPGAEGTVRS